MKLKDTFMSSPICVKILKYQCIPKNFPLLCRQFFQFITLKQTIFFSQLQLANNFFYKKVTSPPPSPDKKIIVHPLDLPETQCSALCRKLCFPFSPIDPLTSVP